MKFPTADSIFLRILALVLAAIVQQSEVIASKLNRIPFTRISVQQGLSQSAVHAITQDRFGYRRGSTALTGIASPSFGTIRPMPPLCPTIGYTPCYRTVKATFGSEPKRED